MVEMTAQPLAHLSAEKIRLLAKRLNQKRAANANAIARLQPNADRYPVTFGQAGLWVIQQLFPGLPSYNVPVAIRIRLPLQAHLWQRVITEIIRRHEVLRTSYQVIDDELIQVVAPATPAVLDVLDLRELGRADRERAAFAAIRTALAGAFELTSGSLWRMGLIAVDDNESIIYAIMHHSICDALSRNIMMREIPELLVPMMFGQAMPVLPQQTLQYGDYARWQRARALSTDVEASLRYWRDNLKDYREFDLPTDHPRPMIPGMKSGSTGFTVRQNTVEGLRELGRTEGATLFMTSLAVFLVLLQRYSGRDDIAVGTPVSTRNRVELEPVLGYFVNMLVLRGDLSSEPTFRELLRRIRQTCINAFEHKDIPFEQLLQGIQFTRDPSRNPMFQISFQVEEALSSELPVNTSSNMAEYLNFDHFSTIVSNLDLVVHLYGAWESAHVKRSEGMRGVFTYDAELFDPETIQRFTVDYCGLLQDVVDSPDTQLSTFLRFDDPRPPRLQKWDAVEAQRWDRLARLGGEFVERAKVEATLREHPEVRDAALILCRHPREGDFVVACIETDPTHPRPANANLRDFLAVRLPEATLPMAWLFMQPLPRNERGEIDCQSLMQSECAEILRPPLAPRDATELRLAELWGELLGRSDVGVHDDFFLLGGHSLLAVQLAAKLAKEFGVELCLRDIFRRPTVAHLAREIINTTHPG